MTESNLRAEIERLEYEIEGIDKEIDWTKGKLENATSEAKRYGAKAASGGGLVFSDDYARGMAEMHLRDIESFEREISDLEKRKRNLLRDLEKCKRQLEKAVRDNSAAAASGGAASGGSSYVPSSYRSSGSGKSRSRGSSSGIRPVSKEKLKETLEAVVIYVLIIAGIMFAAGLVNIGFILSLLILLVGPVVFAVNASKKFYGPGEPKRAAKIFLSYCIGVMLTLAGMTDYNIVSLIMVAGFCYIAALILERMCGAK